MNEQKNAIGDYAVPIGAGILTLIVVCGLVWVSIQSPIQYSEQYYTPEQPAYGRGETMVFHPSLYVRSGSGSINITTSLWRVDSRGTTVARLCDTNPSDGLPGERWSNPLPVYDPPFHLRGKWRETPATLKIANAPPGVYVYRLTAEQWLRRAASFEVWFTVKGPPCA